MLGVGIGIGVNRFRAGGVTANGAGQSFNGTDQYAYIVDTGVDKFDIADAPTDFCVSCFVKLKTYVTGVANQFVGKYDSALSNSCYGIRASSAAGNIAFFYKDGATNRIIPFTNNYTNTDKHHYLARVDTANKLIYCYYDGILTNAGGTAYTGTPVNNAKDLTIGAGANKTEYFSDITAFDVRVYHKDITPQITDLIAGKQLGDEVAWWDLPTLSGFGGTNYDLTGVNL